MSQTVPDPVATALSAFDAAVVARSQQPPKPSLVAAFLARRADRVPERCPGGDECSGDDCEACGSLDPVRMCADCLSYCTEKPMAGGASR